MAALLCDLVKDVGPALPLEVTTASWDGVNLHLSGEKWYFNTMSPWRIVSAEALLQGSDEAKDDSLIRALIGDSVVAVRSAGTPHLDPILEFRSNISLQVFSVHSLEPWTFALPSGEFYVASPSDPRA